VSPAGQSPATSRGEAQRKCVGCLRRLPRAASLRFVASPDGVLVVDPQMRLPGRGAHTCADPGCVARAVKRAGFPRALRRGVDVPPLEQLVRSAASASSRRAHELLGLMRRQGALALGARAVQTLLRTPGAGVELVVVASDHSARSATEVAGLAARAGVPLARFSTAKALGGAIGRPPTGVLGAGEGRLTELLVTEAMKANMLAPPGETDGPDRERR